MGILAGEVPVHLRRERHGATDCELRRGYWLSKGSPGLVKGVILLDQMGAQRHVVLIAVVGGEVDGKRLWKSAEASPRDERATRPRESDARLNWTNNASYFCTLTESNGDKVTPCFSKVVSRETTKDEIRIIRTWKCPTQISQRRNVQSNYSIKVDEVRKKIAKPPQALPETGFKGMS